MSVDLIKQVPDNKKIEEIIINNVVYINKVYKLDKKIYDLIPYIFVGIKYYNYYLMIRKIL
jgi:hypothetical protein